MMSFMKWLSTVDGAVIDRVYQPIADRLADRSSPKQISLFCLMGDIVAVGGLFVVDYINHGMAMDFTGGVGLLLGPVIYLGAAMRPETNGARNPLRVMMIFLLARLSILLGFVLMILVLAIEPNLNRSIRIFGYFCFLSFAYFEACDKRPPARRSVWISATPVTTR